jgi:hydrogenase expression/formation protein HypC
MCLGIPGEVIELHPEQPDLAKVNVSGVRRMINIGLLSDDPPAPGEWVLIHVGFALSKIDEKEAAATLEYLEGVGQAYEDELAALKESLIELQERGEQCGSSTNSVTPTRPTRWPRRSRRCASPGASTS